jgi:hypothetical protein
VLGVDALGNGATVGYVVVGALGSCTGAAAEVFTA